MLNFDKESISVVKGNTTGAIKVKGTLTIVGLPDEFFRAISYVIIIIFSVGYAFADSHDTEQNIIDKAKEINQKIKEKQALHLKQTFHLKLTMKNLCHLMIRS